MKNKKASTILIIIAIVFLALFLTNIEHFKITHYKNSPCYYYVSNDSIKLFNLEPSEVNLYLNSGKTSFFIINNKNNQTIDECQTERAENIPNIDISSSWLNQNANKVNDSSWTYGNYSIMK